MSKHTPGPWYQEANARLIAAAPDLYAACQAALGWFEEYVDANPDNADEEDSVASVLRAALRKARGEEHQP